MAAESIAYIVVQASLLGTINDASAAGDQVLPSPRGDWIQAEIVESSSPVEAVAATAEPSHDDHIDKICSCCLHWNYRGENDTLSLDWESIVPFFGAQADVHCPECQQPRTDISLLLGLLKACRDHVTIQSTRILLHGDGKAQDPVMASMVVTLSFPLLQQGLPGSRYLLAVQQPKTNKHLSPELQLLLSMVESNWNALETNMERLQKEAPLQGSLSTPSIKNISLFPTKISLPELYRRVPGSSGKSDNMRVKVKPPALHEQSPCLLLALPKEILVDKIAPFLRAKSLDSLRCTCTTLHDRLRAVVPGLKLSLYSHQIASLAWMRQRECQAITERDCLETTTTDMHRAVTGGATTFLRSADGQTCVRIYQSTGREVDASELLALPRKVARGGLLCDDPGLGKSITLLSLILQTDGLGTAVETESDTKAGTVGGADDSDLFSIYWTENVSSIFQKLLLRRLINNLRRQQRNTAAIFPSEAIERIVYRIENDEYRASFDGFENDVRVMLDGILHGHGGGSFVGIRSLLMSDFNALVSELKAEQVRSAKKTFANAAAWPNSRVAAMIEKQNQRELMGAMIRTSATLLVVPTVLLGHWKTQIELHIDTKYIVEQGKKPLVFTFHQRPAKGDLTVDEALLLVNLSKSHAPFVFFDMATTRQLPPPEFLALFRVVITSNQRFRNEWKNGSYQKERDRNSTMSSTPSYRLFDREEAACPLLKIHWIRLVVDEGHSMAQAKQNSTIQFASWISAERRWAMTGTPTKQTNAEMMQIYNLMSFLQHGFFTSRLDGQITWDSSVAKTWKVGSLVAILRLQALLEWLMRRHTKLNISELSVPLYRKEVVPVSYVEAATYNTLVCMAKSNILICSMGGEPLGEQDSLLHRSQRKFAKESLDNLRRSCTGYSRVIPTLEHKYFLETIELLENHGVGVSRIETIRQHMIGAQEEQLYPCDCCHLRLSTLLILPCCGGLACPECLDGSRVCLFCDTELDVNDFQKLQPGFLLTWKSAINDRAKSSVSSPSVVSATSLDGHVRSIRELGQGHHDEANMLHQPLIHPSQRPAKKFGDHECIYSTIAEDGRCSLCQHEHEGCVLMNEKRRCPTCHRVCIPCPRDESKAYYLVQTLRKLYFQRHLHSSRSSIEQLDRRPLKAIVFSQFRGVLDVVGTRLIWEFGNACVAEFRGKTRQSELTKFATNNNCFCMLLSKDGSEGLDLSFVTNIFFLEEILDKSLMDQAVARAWRMGAKGRVDVETIIAKNTLEEKMEDMDAFFQGDTALKPRYASLGDLGDTKSGQLSRTHFLLRSLRLLTDYHYFSEAKSAPLLLAKQNEPVNAATKHVTKLPVEDEGEPRSKRVRFA